MASSAPIDAAELPAAVGPTRVGPILLRALVAAIYLFLLGPLIIIIVTSFDPTTAGAFPPRRRR